MERNEFFTTNKENLGEEPFMEKPKPKPRKIISVKCPYCLKNEMVLRRVNNNGERWECRGGCHIVHSTDWFDRFHQFEHLVTREGDEEK